MKYYATIYVDELFGEITRSIDIKNPSTYFDFEFTHAFLGLTKGKSPDELDRIDDEIKLQKLKNADWKDFDKNGMKLKDLTNLMMVFGVLEWEQRKR